MKPIHIVALLVLAGGVAALTMQAKDVSTYATFTDAKEASAKVKVAGKLIKDKPMVYDPVVNPNLFTFYLKDTNGKEVLVNLLKPKPQDFELSEQVVVTGDMQGEVQRRGDLYEEEKRVRLIVPRPLGRELYSG
jgi:cytochrome c-type biogenesis protein CcmE